MHVAVYLPLLAPLFAVPLLRALARALPPRQASAVLLAAMGTLNVGFVAALALLAVAGLAVLPAIAEWAHLSSLALTRNDAVNLPIGVAAAVLTVAVLGAAARSLRSWLRSLAEARAGVSGSPPGLVVLTDDTPVACAVPGDRGWILVSVGMLRQLTGPQRSALLAHEQAHLDGGHHRYLGAARVLAAVNPMIAPLRTELEFALERWADEAAATRVGSREITAHAIGQAALAGPARRPALLAATAGPVPKRVAALLGAEAPQLARVARSPILLLCAALAAGTLSVSAVASAEAATDLQDTMQQASCLATMSWHTEHPDYGWAPAAASGSTVRCASD
ncbi:MAG: M56 family metallopeptidase [Sciscionella sp.]